MLKAFLSNQRSLLMFVKKNEQLKLNLPGFPGEYFSWEFRLPDPCSRWKHNRGLRANGTKTYAKKLINCLN